MKRTIMLAAVMVLGSLPVFAQGAEPALSNTVEDCIEDADQPGKECPKPDATEENGAEIEKLFGSQAETPSSTDTTFGTGAASGATPDKGTGSTAGY